MITIEEIKSQKSTRHVGIKVQSVLFDLMKSDADSEYSTISHWLHKLIINELKRKNKIR